MKKEYNLKKMKIYKRGPLIDPKATKVQKTVRLDYEVVRWLLLEGDKRGLGYQTLLNMILRERMSAETSFITEEKVRAIIRDEIKKSKKAS